MSAATAELHVCVHFSKTNNIVRDKDSDGDPGSFTSSVDSTKTTNLFEFLADPTHTSDNVTHQKSPRHRRIWLISSGKKPDQESRAPQRCLASILIAPPPSRSCLLLIPVKVC